MLRPLPLLACIAAFLPALAGAARAAEPGPPVRDLAELPGDVLPGPARGAYLGVKTHRGVAGLRVGRVDPESPAARAGIRPGDVLTRAAGQTLATHLDLGTLVDGSRAGDVLRLTVRRDGDALVLPVELGEDVAGKLAGNAPEYRVAVVQVAFADEGPALDRRALLECLLFAKTGLRGPGASVADYYAAQSYGTLDFSGEVLAPVRLARPRSHYADMLMGGRRGTLFDEAGRALLAREGSDLLKRIDGLAFVYPGPAETRSGLALWPHRSTLRLAGRQVSYYVHPVGEAEADTVGVHCHEVGHLLGLPDEYGVGHRTGSGDFCLMALGHRGGGETGAESPFSLCAPCRLELGWLRPRVLNPRDLARVRLRPVAADRDQAVILPMDARCTEYLLLEVRRRTGFDRELPSEGLLVWHVGGRASAGQGPYGMAVDLIEAHGIDTFDAALVRTGEVAFPNARARDLTSSTRPSIHARSGNGPVRITRIARERTGAVTFTLGSRLPVEQNAPFPYVPSAPERDGAVVRDDPITGRPVRFYPRSLQRPAALPSASGTSGSER